MTQHWVTQSSRISSCPGAWGQKRELKVQAGLVLSGGSTESMSCPLSSFGAAPLTPGWGDFQPHFRPRLQLISSVCLCPNFLLVGRGHWVCVDNGALEPTVTQSLVMMQRPRLV